MTKYIFYILISFLILGCSTQKNTQRKSYTEKELEKSILVGDFIFVGNEDNDSIPKQKVIEKNESIINPKINKDSLFQVIIKKIHPSKVSEITKMYKEGNDMSKDFFLMMFSMPKSSKKEQIENLEKNEENIKILIQKYSELVPDSLEVYIEFNPKNIILNKDKSIDLKIYSNQKNNQIFRKSDLKYNSDILLQQLEILGWNESTLIKIKNLLDSANCVSIENGEITKIGFARSGMGKYSYKFFKENLNETDQSEYNDGCYNIFYDRNIVLEYGSGAFGQECFEKE